MNGKGRRIAALALSLAIFVIIELVLRIAGVLPPDRPVRHLFSPPAPVFHKSGNEYVVRDEVSMYFPAVSFSAQKSPGSKRIFIAGGSSAMGFPLDSIYGPRQLLAAVLKNIDKENSYEIINAAGYAYASYEVVEVVEEVLDYHPDAIIVMTGHNDFLEKRFPTVTTEGGWLKKRVSGLRLYRLLEGMVMMAKGEFGQEKWMPHKVTDEERELVRLDYRKNLQKIVSLCKEAGVPLVMASCPSNLKDFRPFGPSAVSIPAQENVDRMFREGNLGKAKKELDNLSEEHGRDAWISYEAAQVLWKQAGVLEYYVKIGDVESSQEVALQIKNLRTAAAGLFVEARDIDPWPVRASTSMVEVTREETGGNGVPIADIEAFLREKSFYRLTTDATFFDHCHMKPEGQETLARLLLERLADAGLLPPAGQWQEGPEKIWSGYRKTIPDRAWAEGYFMIANETGINMGRVRRGLSYMETARKLYPGHPELDRLEDTLRPLAKQVPALTGD